MDETFDWSQYSGMGDSATSDLMGGFYGGAPSAYDEFGNVQYGDLWYGQGTTYDDIYGSYDPNANYTAEPENYQYPGSQIIDGTLNPTYDDIRNGGAPSTGLGRAVTDGVYIGGKHQADQADSARRIEERISEIQSQRNMTPQAPTQYPPVPSVPGLQSVTLQPQQAYQSGTPQAMPVLNEDELLGPLRAGAAQRAIQAAANGEGFDAPGFGAAAMEAAGAGLAGGAVKPADLPPPPKKKVDPNEGRIANGFIWKDGKWQKLPPRAQPNMGPQQMGPPRMAQGGQARPPQMRQIPGMGGGGRAAGMPNLARPMPRGVGGVSGAAGGGRGTAAGPKPNTGPLKDLLKEWKTSYQKAVNANESRYAEVLAGFKQNTTDVLAQNDTQSASAKEDVQRAYGRAAADAIQSARARGLSNTTVLDSLTRGVESDRQRATRGIENDRITRLTQLMNQLKNQELGFMERREDTYPSMEMMANLAREIGRADPNGTYDYAELLGTTT